MAKISFCITYYNQENFVKDSIESILNQKGDFESEILIGDDGSTDNTINEVKKYQEQFPDKIKYFIMPREDNKKYNPIHRASANRLNLVKHASGKYIMFLDGDDFYSNFDFIENAISILENNNKLIGVAHNFEYYYPNENKKIQAEQPLKEGIINSSKYIRKCYYTPAGAICFRNIFDSNNIQILEKTKNFDDNLITLYMLNFGEFYYIPKTIYTYRQSQNSICNKMNQCEKYILCAMDYDIISKILAKYKNELLARHYGGIKYIFQNKQVIDNLINKDKLNSYIQENINEKNKFIIPFLTWNKLNILQKFNLIIRFYKIKIINKIYKRY